MPFISKKIRKQLIELAPIVLFSSIVGTVAGLNVMALCWLFRIATPQSSLLAATLFAMTVFATLLLIHGNRDRSTPLSVAKTQFEPTRLRTRQSGTTKTY